MNDAIVEVASQPEIKKIKKPSEAGLVLQIIDQASSQVLFIQQTSIDRLNKQNITAEGNNATQFEIPDKSCLANLASDLNLKKHKKLPELLQEEIVWVIEDKEGFANLINKLGLKDSYPQQHYRFQIDGQDLSGYDKSNWVLTVSYKREQNNQNAFRLKFMHKTAFNLEQNITSLKLVSKK